MFYKIIRVIALSCWCFLSTAYGAGSSNNDNSQLTSLYGELNYLQEEQSYFVKGIEYVTEWLNTNGY